MKKISAVVLNGTYQSRNPKESFYYKCVDVHCEELERTWDIKFHNQYGNWRPHIQDVVYRYLNCGDLHNGFARIYCDGCKHEHLLAFSCKCRAFCPSCHQKRVVEFGEYIEEEILEKIPHRHWVFSIPKRLRVYFMYNRKLLAKLSRCVWNVLTRYLQTSVRIEDGMAGAIISVHTFGEFINFNPHFHVIATDGCFDRKGQFEIGIAPKGEDLEKAFQIEVLEMMEKEGVIDWNVYENMMNWKHSGFQVYVGQAVEEWNKKGIERLAQYIVRAPLSQERMKYIPADESGDGVAKVIYQGKTTETTQVFNAVDWLAKLVTHIPNRGEQLVRYYGYYSNKCRGRRKGEVKEGQTVLEGSIGRKKFRKNWARLIQKIYNVNPMICPKCGQEMRILAFIEENETIEKILRHLNLWHVSKGKAPPKDNTLECEYVKDEYVDELPDYQNYY